MRTFAAVVPLAECISYCGRCRYISARTRVVPSFEIGRELARIPLVNLAEHAVKVAVATKQDMSKFKKPNPPMPSIRISATEVLDAKRIKSFKASKQEMGEGAERERVLTITKTDGQNITLHGDLADNALAILRLHGF